MSREISVVKLKKVIISPIPTQHSNHTCTRKFFSFRILAKSFKYIFRLFSRGEELKSSSTFGDVSLHFDKFNEFKKVLPGFEPVPFTALLPDLSILPRLVYENFH